MQTIGAGADESEVILGISDRQKEIYDHLAEVLLAGDPVPTVATLGKAFGISQQAMSKNLKVLENEGYIRRKPNRHRSIELVDTPPKATRVPLLGKIAAGRPLEAIESQRDIEIPESLLPSHGDVYALEVEGESMIEDGIMDGDYVIIRKQTTAYDGQTVVGVINGEATLKRYYHEGSRIRLQPANATLNPIYATRDDQFEIRGIAHALYRQFSEH